MTYLVEFGIMLPSDEKLKEAQALSWRTDKMVVRSGFCAEMPNEALSNGYSVAIIEDSRPRKASDPLIHASNIKDDYESDHFYSCRVYVKSEELAADISDKLRWPRAGMKDKYPILLADGYDVIQACRELDSSFEEIEFEFDYSEDEFEWARGKAAGASKRRFAL